MCAKGHEETRGNDRPGARQGVKEREVGMGVGALCDGEVGNGLQGDVELGHKGLCQQDIGGDDAVICGQRSAVGVLGVRS